MFELFTSPIFNRYQVKMIQSMNDHIVGLLKQGKYEQVRGAMDIAHKLLKLPAVLKPNENIEKMQIENMKRFQSGFIRGSEDES